MLKPGGDSNAGQPQTISLGEYRVEGHVLSPEVNKGYLRGM